MNKEEIEKIIIEELEKNNIDVTPDNVSKVYSKLKNNSYDGTALGKSQLKKDVKELITGNNIEFSDVGYQVKYKYTEKSSDGTMVTKTDSMYISRDATFNVYTLLNGFSWSYINNAQKATLDPPESFNTFVDKINSVGNYDTILDDIKRKVDITVKELFYGLHADEDLSDLTGIREGSLLAEIFENKENYLSAVNFGSNWTFDNGVYSDEFGNSISLEDGGICIANHSDCIVETDNYGTTEKIKVYDETTTKHIYDFNDEEIKTKKIRTASQLETDDNDEFTYQIRGTGNATEQLKYDIPLRRNTVKYEEEVIDATNGCTESYVDVYWTGQYDSEGHKILHSKTYNAKSNVN